MHIQVAPSVFYLVSNVHRLQLAASPDPSLRSCSNFSAGRWPRMWMGISLQAGRSRFSILSGSAPQTPFPAYHATSSKIQDLNLFDAHRVEHSPPRKNGRNILNSHCDQASPPPSQALELQTQDFRCWSLLILRNHLIENYNEDPRSIAKLYNFLGRMAVITIVRWGYT